VIETASIADTEKRLNLLVAYPYLKGRMLETLKAHEAYTRLVVDSGAFTAWKAGKPIALDDYCQFLETLPVTPWRYFTLDVIGDPHGTMKNYETMLARGFKPVPIFTRGEDPSVLDDLYKTSDLVGVGGLVGTQGNTGFVNGIMAKIGTRRVHWLGFTRIEFLRVHRPYMCDASSWEGGARFGVMQLYIGGGRLRTIQRGGEFAKRPPPEVTLTLQRYGFEPSDLRHEASWRGGPSLNRRICAASWVAYSLDVQKHLGTLMFLAVAASEGCGMLADAYRYQTKKDRQ
jgi:hypothetical protein